ncbi:hypothetical protein OL229_10760 [Neisseriaceae bacterium JH1-16]|nr:hypothetical protein [Neisseriaceae bacterium JH1-16]
MRQSASIDRAGRRAVFMAVASQADDTFVAIATMADVAALTGLSPAGLKHHLGHLRRAGLLWIEDLGRREGFSRGTKRFNLQRTDATAPKLADLVASPQLSAALARRTGGNEVLTVEALDPDETDLHDAAVMLHADGTVTLLLAPMGDLDVPEFLSCMAEVRRRAGELGQRFGRQVRAGLATHERPGPGRVLAVMSACREYGVYYLPLPNLMEQM